MASFVSTKLLRSTTSTQARSFLRSSPSLIRSSPYSTAPSPTDVQPSASTSSDDSAAPSQCSEIEAKHAELVVQLEGKNKTIAELKDARLRTLADFENLQKISTREKAQAKDFALTSFARDLVSSIDILSLALKSVPEHKLAPHPTTDVPPNPELVQLHEGVSLTKKEIERVLKRHGVVAFDPVGEVFDPNFHEALYQAPVPGKEPGTVLETQEIGYRIKDRLLRPAKVGVVLASE